MADAPLSIPTSSDTFVAGDVTMKIDPGKGARIVSFTVAGSNNVLTGPEVNSLNYGSTFWPSPQSAWGWPPPTTIDSEAYETFLEPGRVRAVGQADEDLGIAVTKIFEARAEERAIDVTYTMTNQGTKAVSLAPWEISRVPTAGLTFFPTGEVGEIVMEGAGVKPRLHLEDEGGVTWFAWRKEEITDHMKSFADGAEGWLAHVEGDLLLVKVFEPIESQQRAPEEAEIELYANLERTYVEVEQQGPYTKIEPGKSVDWKVRWLLRRLPSGMSATVGNADLVAFVRALVASPSDN